MTWRASVLNAGIDGEPVEPPGDRYVNGDEVLLPRFGPRTNLSFVLQSGGSAGESNLLLVLAAPGTDRIEFTGCDGTTVVRRAADGDTLQADAEPLDAPGGCGCWTAPTCATTGRRCPPATSSGRADRQA